MNDNAPPLSDLLVVDLSRVVTGPYAAMMLGDLGARVIKVERPEGDDTRRWGPPFVGPEDRRESTYFLSVNRNKESIVLDLKQADDLAVLERLVARADVVIENFRPGVLERFGVGHQRMLELNPRLVVLSITGFGHDGPEAQRAGYDQIVQGEAGLMGFTGPPGEPTKVGVPIADLLAGMFGAYGVLAALRERDRGGAGQVVRTSLLAGVVATHTYQGGRYLIGGEVPEPGGNRHPSIAPYSTYRCRDGVIQVAVGNEPIWRRFAELLEIDRDDARFSTNHARLENADALDALIAERLGAADAATWLERFAELGIPAGEVKSLDQVYASPQVRSQGLVAETEHPTLGSIRTPGPPLRFDRSPGVDHRAPPELGEHSAAIRRWLDG
ncbi:MAG TPA: CoA transferase [Solirubrobacterales bacterium]|nr:CoA transferase [Solirubrobacterales bacterium]